LSDGSGELIPLTGQGTVDVTLGVEEAIGAEGSRTLVLEAARFNFAPVAEPGTLLLIATGLAAVGVSVRTKPRRREAFSVSPKGRLRPPSHAGF
jgi:hypothetical protein